MKVYTVVFLVSVLAFVNASNNGSTIQLEPEDLVTTAKITTTSKPSPSTTTSTTAIPLTTTPAPIPTTPAPTPTTPAPTPTTPAPTSTTPAPPPTTSAPSPTTPAPGPTPTTPAPGPTPTTPAPGPTPTTPAPGPTPTTPAPGPTPTTPAPTPKHLETGKWSLNYTLAPNDTISNYTCMTVQLALLTEVHYNTTKNTTQVAYINLPKNASVSGTCGTNKTGLLETMILTWDNSNKIKLTFTKDNQTSKFYLGEIVINLGNVTELPNSNLTTYTLLHQRAEFNTTGIKSYKCDKIQYLQLSGAESHTQIHVSNVQLQAFTNTTNGAFNDAEDCEPLETPDVVPIAVGCSLVVLVVVVLAAYLIGRRRREGRGYLSIDVQS